MLPEQKLQTIGQDLERGVLVKDAQDRELVAPDPGDNIGFPERTAQNGRQVEESLVALQMPEPVVVTLQPVEVDVESECLGVDPAAHLQKLAAEGLKAAAVIKSGQGVRHRQALEGVPKR